MTDIVPNGTLVLMHGSAFDGSRHDGLAFVHEHYPHSQYNLVAFEHIDRDDVKIDLGEACRYVREAGNSRLGWYGGVARDQFTVVELPAVPMRDGVYISDVRTAYRRKEGRWTTWSAGFSGWLKVSLNDGVAKDRGLVFLHGL